MKGNRYIKLDGTLHIGRFMDAPMLKPGHHWQNVTPLGHAPQTFVETPTPKPEHQARPVRLWPVTL